MALLLVCVLCCKSPGHSFKSCLCLRDITGEAKLRTHRKKALFYFSNIIFIILIFHISLNAVCVCINQFAYIWVLVTQVFLSSLKPPITIPDHKVTHWHPKFCVENVPEIEPAELPKAENVLVITTAKDALEQVKKFGNNSRVSEGYS